ncbi:MAG: helix-hairpin-helix domain-containing protein, partial [Terriglobales bacterium]
VGNQATPLASVPDLGEALVEQLTAGGITTVEQLADMTPEQLEAIPGIGPKTVEKISIAVNNYFSSLEAGETPAAAPNLDVAEDEPVVADAGDMPPDDVGPDSAGQSGDTEGLSQLADMAPQSVSELVEEGQNLEVEVVGGAENAPPADEAEVTTHETHPDEEKIPPEEK